MRNDARPIGPDEGHQSPLSEQHSSDVVNRADESPIRFRFKPEPHGDRAPAGSAADSDPALPANDSTLNTKI